MTLVVLEMLIIFYSTGKVLFHLVFSLSPVIYDILKRRCIDYFSKIIMLQMSYRLIFFVI